MSRLPEGFDHPRREDLPTDHHLRPWVFDREAGGPLERALDELVPRRLSERWGFRSVDDSPS